MLQTTLVFDLDGTLADTSGDMLAAANSVLGPRGVTLGPDARRAAMRGVTAMVDRALYPGHPELPRLYPAILAAYSADLHSRSHLFDGVRAALAALAAHPLAVCTNKPEALARRLLDHLGIATDFKAIIGGDTLPVKKPDAEPLREAIRRAGGDPTRAIMVGDTQTDLTAARAAGLPCILVPFGAEADPAGLRPDAVMDHFDALPGLVAMLAHP